MTVYHFPIWLRKFVYKSIEDHYDKISKNDDELTNQNHTKNPARDVARPAISPKNTYVTKAPKK